MAVTNKYSLVFRSLPFGNGKLHQWGYYKKSCALTLHNLNGPAMIREGPNGVKAAYWLVHGKHHREGNPAWIDFGSCHRKWYLNGKLHRDDGPAITIQDNIEEWWQHGTIHREDGPAWIHKNKTSWYYNGRLHRTDGPASNATGKLEWSINGRRTSLAGMLSDSQVSDEEKIMIVLKYGHLLENTDN